MEKFGAKFASKNNKNLPLKRAKDGSIITLSDVSRIELGAESTRTVFKGNGKQVVGIGIYQQSDANTTVSYTHLRAHET